jgi:hypothetical protein
MEASEMGRRGLAIGLLVLVSALASSDARAAEQASLMGYAKSSSMRSNNTDLINGVPTPGTLLRIGGPAFSVRSVPLGDLSAGEKVKALSEVEVTNDLVSKDEQGTNLYHTVLGGLALVIADSPEATSGIEIAEAQSSYVTPEVHHWTFEKSATFTAPTDLSGKYVNLVMWASMPDPPDQCWTFPRASQPSPQQPRDCGLDVNYNRGHLSVLRFAPAAIAPAGATPFSVADTSGTSLPEASPADVPITYAGEAAQFIVGLSRPVGSLEDGDVITAHSELQADARDVVRSNPSCNAMLASRLYLSPEPDSYNAAGAFPIGNEAGYNFTGQGSHPTRTLEQGVVPSSTTVQLTQDYPQPMYVVLRIWSVGNSACDLYGHGIRIQLSQPDSFMHVVRYRQEASAGLVPDTLNSGDDSERASGLDVVAHTPVSVYSVPITDLAPGDRVEALAEVELETTDRRAGIHSSFVLADSPDATSWVPLQVDDETEINPYMQDLPIHAATGWTVADAVPGTSYLNLVMYGVGLGKLGDPPTDSVAIVQDGGRMVVQRFRAPDVTPPETSIDSAPPDPTNDATPTLAFSSSELGSTFECRFDASPFAACSGPGATHAPPAALSQGVHTFEVRATDAAANTDPTPAADSFTVDTVPPETEVDSGPSGPTADPTPTFGFSASEQVASFECRLDSAPFGPCSGPGAIDSSGPLANGPHRFEVRATDPAGNVGTAAGRDFSVDTVAPLTWISSGPRGRTKRRHAVFKLRGRDEQSSLRLECRLDRGRFRPCGDTVRYRHLALGRHLLRVRAVDAAGNADPTPAGRAWRVVKRRHRRSA